MRLTLRTLLAYLDDTLEPLEIKTIGQKVAESETAQELVNRIKQVTRRRRITTPPLTGPNSFDPNTVAEYLDNTLSPEQVAEVEKLCLESDVHLAEVASCHQILTLVLGEPAVVPPKAKERMYALVRGREAIPFRKATGARTSAPTSTDADADEMFLLGLPFYRSGNWLRWALPLVAVLLFAIVGLALWQLIYGIQQPATPVAQRPSAETNVPEKSTKAPSHTEEKTNAPENKNPPAAQPPTPQPTTPQPTTPQPSTPPPSNTKETAQANPAQAVPSNPPERVQAEVKKDTGLSTGKLEKAPAGPATGRETPPSKEQVVVGQYRIPDYSPPSLLVQQKEKDGWVRLKPGASVTSGAPIMSLPGYASEVQLDCGIHLLLRGHLREFTPQLLVKDPSGRERNEAALMDYLQESAIVLHKAKDTDVDLTLLRGRLYFSNHKANDSRGLTVRLRFENKVWDVTLYPGAEVVVDLIKTHYPGTGDPVSALKLFLLTGEAGIALEHERYPDFSEPGRAQFSWMSLNPNTYDRPYISKQELDTAKRVLFSKRPTIDTPQARDMELALKAVRDRMTVDKDPRTALQETLTLTNRYAEHQLALYCLAALDEVKDLLDIISKADAIYAPDRDTAIVALWRWLDHGKGQREKLFDPKTGQGLLPSALGYTSEESKRILDLFREPTDEEIISRPDFYMALARDLTSDKVALAELARFWLSRLALGLFHLDLPNLKKFNAAMPQDRREAARREVEQAIDEGRLPPLEPGKPRPGGGAPLLPKR
jgi:cytoskeletal protein RodZ